MAGYRDDETEIFETGEEQQPQGQPEPRQEVTVPDSHADQLVSSAISSMQREQLAPVARRYAPPAPTTEPPGRQPSPHGGADPGTQGILEALREERRSRQALEQQIQELRNPRQQQSEAPFAQRLFEDPDNAFDGRVRQYVEPIAQQLQTMRTDMAFQLAEAKHGTEKFSQAYQAWFQQVGDPAKPDPQTYWAIMNASSPGEALIKWHRQQTEMPDGDYDAYRARIEREILEKHGLAPPEPVQNGNGATPPRAPDGKFTPRHEVRLPTPTSRMGHTSREAAFQPEDGSDEAIFDHGRAPSQRR